jgi:hypothetical protein
LFECCCEGSRSRSLKRPLNGGRDDEEEEDEEEAAVACVCVVGVSSFRTPAMGTLVFCLFVGD